jgi:predicted nucleic acid-binding protein
VYAYNRAAAGHARARAWWEDLIGLAWAVVLGFVRLVTHPAVLVEPLAPPAALAIEHQAELHSNDTDFARFPGPRWRNPLA